jgi:hypothetical protein
MAATPKPVRKVMKRAKLQGKEIAKEHMPKAAVKETAKNQYKSLKNAITEVRKHKEYKVKK